MADISEAIDVDKSLEYWSLFRLSSFIWCKFLFVSEEKNYLRNAYKPEKWWVYVCKSWSDSVEERRFCTSILLLFFSARCLLCFFGYGLAGNYILIAVLTYCISKSAAVFVSYNKKSINFRSFLPSAGVCIFDKMSKVCQINYYKLCFSLCWFDGLRANDLLFFKLLYFSRHKMKLVQNWCHLWIRKKVFADEKQRIRNSPLVKKYPNLGIKKDLHQGKFAFTPVIEATLKAAISRSATNCQHYFWP